MIHVQLVGDFVILRSGDSCRCVLLQLLDLFSLDVQRVLLLCDRLRLGSDRRQAFGDLLFHTLDVVARLDCVRAAGHRGDLDLEALRRQGLALLRVLDHHVADHPAFFRQCVCLQLDRDHVVRHRGRHVDRHAVRALELCDIIGADGQDERFAVLCHPDLQVARAPVALVGFRRVSHNRPIQVDRQLFYDVFHPVLLTVSSPARPAVPQPPPPGRP